MLNVEVITVQAGGMIYSGWTSAKVTAGIAQAAREFHLETTEHPGQWNFRPGTPVKVYANADLLCDGYTNAYEASGDSRTHRISIRGRGKGQDFIDSSAEHETGYFENKHPGQIAEELDQGSVGISTKVRLDPVDYWQLTPGETRFQSIERMLRPQGASMMGEADGTISIVNAEVAKAHYGILVEGQNIKSFQLSLTDGSRHSKYIVKGQRRLGTGASSLRVKESAKDKGVKRDRPKTIINETDTDPKRARNRAHHEKERAAGKSIKVSLQTQGFRDFKGELFAPNRLIMVHAPILLHLSQIMLIEQVQFTKDKGGSLCDLQLVDPRAYKGKGGKGGVPSSPAGSASAESGSTSADETDDAYTDGLDDAEDDP